MESKELLRKHFDELRARKAALEERSRPLREKRDKKLAAYYALRDEIKALTAEIKAVEEPEIITLSNEIGKLGPLWGGSVGGAA